MEKSAVQLVSNLPEETLCKLLANREVGEGKAFEEQEYHTRFVSAEIWFDIPISSRRQMQIDRLSANDVCFYPQDIAANVLRQMSSVFGDSALYLLPQRVGTATNTAAALKLTNFVAGGWFYVRHQRRQPGPAVLLSSRT